MESEGNGCEIFRFFTKDNNDMALDHEIKNRLAAIVQQNANEYHLLFYSALDRVPLLVRNLRKAAPDSSQRPALVKANSPAIPYNRQKRRNSVHDLQNI